MSGCAHPSLTPDLSLQFSHGFWENPGPHACASSTLSTEPSVQPCSCLLGVKVKSSGGPITTKLSARLETRFIHQVYKSVQVLYNLYTQFFPLCFFFYTIIFFLFLTLSLHVCLPLKYLSYKYATLIFSIIHNKSILIIIFPKALFSGNDFSPLI